MLVIIYDGTKIVLYDGLQYTINALDGTKIVLYDGLQHAINTFDIPKVFLIYKLVNLFYLF